MIRGFLNRAGYDVLRYPHTPSPAIDVLRIVLEHAASLTPEFFFIQVGANDGVTYDPIRKYILKYHWHGILIEPQPDIFRKLVANYDGEAQLRFENAAIAPEDGVVSLFTVDDLHLHVLASFEKEHLSKHKLPKGTPLKELKVPALSVSSLLSRHAVSRIDLLQIDVEGYDFDIIKMFDFNQIKPKIIRFEHAHMAIKTRRECWNYLADWGYSLLTSGMDTLALLGPADKNGGAQSGSHGA